MHELSDVWQIEIDQLPTTIADSMVVTLRFAIVTAGAVAEANLVNEASFFQIAKGVVDGCVANPWQFAPGRLEYIVGGWVIVSLLNYLEHGFSLRCQVWGT